jgi:hypothetical protein
VAVSEDRTTPEIVTEIRSRGLTYVVGTPQTQAEWDDWNGMGVNGMFVDDVAGYLATCSGPIARSSTLASAVRAYARQP